MAKSVIKVQVKPSLQVLGKRNKKRINQLKKLQIPHARIAVFLDGWVQRNFKSEGGFVGGWQKFKAGGRRIKGSIDRSAKLLQDTGRLRASFLLFSNSKNAGIGSDIHYAKKHNDGLEGLPKRRMLPKEQEIKSDIKDIYTGFIRKNMVVRPEKIKR